MPVRRSEKILSNNSVGEAIDIVLSRAFGQQACYVNGGRPAMIRIFVIGPYSKGLAHVLLMNAYYLVVFEHAVVACDDNGWDTIEFVVLSKCCWDVDLRERA